MKRQVLFTKISLTLLCVCMLVIGFIGMGMTAYAAGSGHTGHDAWTELQVVPSGAMTGGRYYLTSNFTCETTNDCTLGSGGSSCQCTDHHTVIPGGVTVEICLNGYTLDLGHCGIEVQTGGTLKIHDC